MTDMQKRAAGWVPDVSTFGARLALVRQAMGWGNVKQAAELCAIPPQTWRTWERDNIEPKSLISACMKIAGVTGVDYRWLALGPVDQSAADSPSPQRVTAQYPPPGVLGERVITSIPSASAAISTDVRYGVRATPLRG